MNFIFLRHAEYEQPKGVPSALLPHPLTSDGFIQAKEGAKKLCAFFDGNPDLLPPYIECSILLRAYQTAQIIQEEIHRVMGVHIPIKETAMLVERQMGPLANLTVSEIEAVLASDTRYENPPKGWKSSRDYKLPYLNCESLAMAGKRVAKYIQFVDEDMQTAKNKNSDIYRILIGHGASFRHASFELGVLKLDDIPKLSMFYAEPLMFKQTSKGFLHVAGDWKVRTKSDKID